MINSDEPRPPIEETRLPTRRSRLFWTATAMAILAILFLCAALMLIAAARR